MHIGKQQTLYKCRTNYYISISLRIHTQHTQNEVRTTESIESNTHTHIHTNIATRFLTSLICYTSTSTTFAIAHENSTYVEKWSQWYCKLEWLQCGFSKELCLRIIKNYGKQYFNKFFKIVKIRIVDDLYQELTELNKISRVDRLHSVVWRVNLQTQSQFPLSSFLLTLFTNEFNFFFQNSAQCRIMSEWRLVKTHLVHCYLCRSYIFTHPHMLICSNDYDYCCHEATAVAKICSIFSWKSNEIKIQRRKIGFAEIT